MSNLQECTIIQRSVAKLEEDIRGYSFVVQFSNGLLSIVEVTRNCYIKTKEFDIVRLPPKRYIPLKEFKELYPND
jgi:hypothetical protein